MTERDTLREDLKEIKGRLFSIELSQGRMETDVKHHIRRTDLLEAGQEKQGLKVEALQTVVHETRGALRVLKISASILTAVGVAVGIYTALRGV